ncbi:MAG: 3D domain-containing protein [Lentisphaeraceae bacterium]|nr:3D domain-containing protein [Lentisphaeraceae bacterium]
MSRFRITRCLVAVIFLLAFLAGCQQQYQTRNTTSSYKFVDTTKASSNIRTEKKTTGTPVEQNNKCSIPVNSTEAPVKASVSKQKVAVKKKNYQVKIMTVTAYCPCATCCGWKINRYGNPVFNYGSKRGYRKKVGFTSTDTRADVGTIAADTRSIPYGTKLYVQGYGFGVVEDTGGALKGNHIDIFFNSHSQAMRWGVKSMKVAVWEPEKN